MEALRRSLVGVRHVAVPMMRTKRTHEHLVIGPGDESERVVTPGIPNALTSSLTAGDVVHARSAGTGQGDREGVAAHSLSESPQRYTPADVCCVGDRHGDNSRGAT